MKNIGEFGERQPQRDSRRYSAAVHTLKENSEACNLFSGKAQAPPFNLVSGDTASISVGDDLRRAQVGLQAAAKFREFFGASAEGFHTPLQRNILDEENEAQCRP